MSTKQANNSVCHIQVEKHRQEILFFLPLLSPPSLGIKEEGNLYNFNLSSLSPFTFSKSERNDVLVFLLKGKKNNFLPKRIF